MAARQGRIRDVSEGNGRLRAGPGRYLVERMIDVAARHGSLRDVAARPGRLRDMAERQRRLRDAARQVRLSDVTEGNGRLIAGPSRLRDVPAG